MKKLRRDAEGASCSSAGWDAGRNLVPGYKARLGQKNGLVRQWAKRGSRPRQPADQRYENAYLFGAICPAKGKGAALALPFADTNATQRHINEIAHHVEKGVHAV